MTKIILVRHGQSMSNVTRHFACHFDSPLSPLGRKQAVAVADYLVPSIHIDKIYASPLSRTTDTVRPTAERLGLSIEPEAGLIEIGAGEWENRPMAELLEQDPEFLRWSTDFANTRCTGGESVRELFARVRETLLRLAKANEGKTILLASHWTPVCAAVTLAAGGSADDMMRYNEIKNAALHFLTYENGTFTLERMAFAAHLEDITE